MNMLNECRRTHHFSTLITFENVCQIVKYTCRYADSANSRIVLKKWKKLLKLREIIQLDSVIARVCTQFGKRVP